MFDLYLYHIRKQFDILKIVAFLDRRGGRYIKWKLLGKK